MTQDEAAEWLAVSRKELREAVSRGELPILRIGAQIRLSRVALIARGSGITTADTTAAGPVAQPELQEAGSPRNGRADLPTPAGLDWRTELTTTEPFEHRWPAQGGSSLEKYPRAWAGTVTLGGVQMVVLVGEATGAERHDGKRRLTVLLDGYPMAEFAPTSDGSGWASLIKPDGRHTVSPSGPFPPLYRDAQVEPYQRATGLSGRGRPTGAALIIGAQDIQSAVHHAAARWLARNGHSVEPRRGA